MPLFLLRLGYQDSTIWVERATQLGDNYDPRDVSLYDVLIRWDGSEYRVTRQPHAAGPPVPIGITPAGFAVMPGAVRRGSARTYPLPAASAIRAIDMHNIRKTVQNAAQTTRIDSGITAASLTQAFVSWPAITRTSEKRKVVIERVRGCGRAWVRARSSFVTEP